MPDLSDTVAKCRIGTAKNFTLLLLLYHTKIKSQGSGHRRQGSQFRPESLVAEIQGKDHFGTERSAFCQSERGNLQRSGKQCRGTDLVQCGEHNPKGGRFGISCWKKAGGKGGADCSGKESGSRGRTLCFHAGGTIFRTISGKRSIFCESAASKSAIHICPTVHQS